jgi:hypothetical protein
VNTENVQDGDSNDEHGTSQQSNPFQTNADDECIPDENTVPQEIATEDVEDEIIFNEDGIIEKPETAFRLTGFILYKKVKKRGMLTVLLPFRGL